MLNPEQQAARYIDSLGTEALEKAAAYTSGGHWLLLWGLVVTAASTWLIIRFGLLDKLYARLEGRNWGLRTWLVCAAFFLLSTFIEWPWSIWVEWGRETAYGRTSQPLGDFLSQEIIGIVMFALFGGLFFMGVYALIRRTQQRWWLWSAGLAGLSVTLLLLLAPVLIEPIFNEYKPVPQGPVRTALEAMADEAGIPHDRIFLYDGSRQSNNFTANVSGVFGTARIAISDVALKGASLDEVKAVTGHEIGHYVLGHIWHRVVLVLVLALAGFWLADRLYPRFARWLGSKAEIGDPRGLPVLMLVLLVLGTLAQPLFNASVRAGERAADAYSLRTVNLPDALASALVKTAEYRYPRPSALQEMLFYTHPSVERRVLTAMEWKAGEAARSKGATGR